MRYLILAAIVALLVPFQLVQAGPAFTFECADPSGAPTTGCDVNLDPDFHDGDPGTLLFHATTAGKRTITLPDLTGSHRIVVRAAAKTSAGTNTSVIVETTDPTGCASGWAPMGYQSWWESASLTMRHNHIDAICWPVNNLIVNGSQTFVFQLQLHGEIGATLTRVRLKDYPGGSDRWVAPKPYPQPDANGNLIAQFQATINLSALSAGRHEFRWGVYTTQPDGKVQLLSTRSEICIRSCSPAYRSGVYQGNGSWYANDSPIGYVDARIHTAFPVVP